MKRTLVILAILLLCASPLYAPGIAGIGPEAEFGANVKRYGALGDGSTDDTVAIQAAADSLTSGGTVFFPEGTYIVSDRIAVGYDDIWFEGVGWGSIIKVKDATLINRTLYSGTYEGAIFYYANLTGGGVRDLMMNCNNTGASDAQGVVMQDCNQMTVEHIYIYDNVSNGIFARGNSNNIKILNNRIETAYIVSADVDPANYQGIAIGGHTSAHRNFILTGNTVLGAMDDAIVVHKNVEHFVIADNTVSLYSGRVCALSASHGTISNNSVRFLNDTSYGIMTSREDGTSGDANNIVISGNTLIVPTGVFAQYPISIRYGNYVDVIGNSVYCRGTGYTNLTIEIKETSSYVNVVGNMLRGASSDGVGISTVEDYVNITDNVIVDFDYSLRLNLATAESHVVATNNYCISPDEAWIIQPTAEVGILAHNYTGDRLFTAASAVHYENSAVFYENELVFY